MNDQTICVDNCECVYCGNKFDGRNATNSNMDCCSVDCPKCGKEMLVSISVEYTCTAIEDDKEQIINMYEACRNAAISRSQREEV